MGRAPIPLTCACSESQCSHRRDHAVLAEKNRTAVQGAVRLTFGRHEHDGTGRNIVLACWNKSNYRHIGGGIYFFFATLISHGHPFPHDRRIAALHPSPFHTAPT